MLRDEITREVNKDATLLAGQIFNQRRPDQSHASNEQYDAIIHQRIATEDRDWLTQEAQRAPNEFQASIDRLKASGQAHDPPLPPPANLPPAVPMVVPQQPTLPVAPAPGGLPGGGQGMSGPVALPPLGTPTPPSAPLPPATLPVSAPVMPTPPVPTVM